MDTSVPTAPIDETPIASTTLPPMTATMAPIVGGAAQAPSSDGLHDTVAPQNPSIAGNLPLRLIDVCSLWEIFAAPASGSELSAFATALLKGHLRCLPQLLLPLLWRFRP